MLALNNMCLLVLDYKIRGDDFWSSYFLNILVDSLHNPQAKTTEELKHN